MKISLKNKIIKINLSVSTTPNLEKLEKELTDFFSKKDIEGYRIKQFRIEEGIPSGYRIIPLEPSLEECLSDRKESRSEEIEEIGKRYGIKYLGFIYWCYHK